MYFHRHTPYDPLPSLKNHPTHFQPYFGSITSLHNEFPSFEYLHSHFLNNAFLNILKFCSPKPSFTIGKLTFCQLTRWNLFSSPIPPQKKGLKIFSIRFATPTDNANKERQYVGRLKRVLLIRVNLPPFDRYSRFQPNNLFSNLLYNTVPNILCFEGHPQGKPKQALRYLKGFCKSY